DGAGGRRDWLHAARPELQGDLTDPQGIRRAFTGRAGATARGALRLAALGHRRPSSQRPPRPHRTPRPQTPTEAVSAAHAATAPRPKAAGSKALGIREVPFDAGPLSIRAGLGRGRIHRPLDQAETLVLQAAAFPAAYIGWCLDSG